MDVYFLQQSLIGLGHEVDEDGEAGEQTWQALVAEVGRNLPGLGVALAEEMEPAGIDTPLRVAHFLAQAAHESDGFNALVEPGGPDIFVRFDSRIDLGNTRKGDGYRFRGRGLLPIVGRAAYLAYSARLDMDLVAHPDAAAQVGPATAIACIVWQYKGLNELADRGDLRAVTRKLTGGVRGMARREAYLALIKHLWGLV
jgi:putative chitinase